MEEEIIDEVYFKYGKVVGSIWAKKALDDKIEHTLGLDPTVCCVGHQSVMPKGKVNSILGFRKDVDAIDDWELSYFLGWATGARKIIDRINGMCF